MAFLYNILVVGLFPSKLLFKHLFPFCLILSFPRRAEVEKSLEPFARSHDKGPSQFAVLALVGPFERLLGRPRDRKRQRLLKVHRLLRSQVLSCEFGWFPVLYWLVNRVVVLGLLRVATRQRAALLGWVLSAARTFDLTTLTAKKPFKLQAINIMHTKKTQNRAIKKLLLSIAKSTASHS